MYAFICVCISSVYVSVYFCIYVYTHICIYLNIYIYIYIHMEYVHIVYCVNNEVPYRAYCGNTDSTSPLAYMTFPPILSLM